MNEIQAYLKVFESRKMAALLFLGFASGLPLFLTSRTLQAWMTTEGVDLKSIGLFSLVALPYSLKFLWSPLLDRFVPPFLGRRRGWLVIAQVGLVLAIAAMYLQDPSELVRATLPNPDSCSTGLAGIREFQALCVFWQSFQAVSRSPLFWTALGIAFLSATQDIAYDAYRTDVLEKWEMGAGAAIGVLGYRLALILTGSIAFILADRMPWPVVYLLLAGLMLLSVIPSFLAPEPPKRDDTPQTLSEAVWLPFQEFFARSGLTRGISILIFIVLYRLGDALINNMVTPFLLQIGFSATKIGTIQGGMGMIATIVGVLVGGSLLSRWGINRSLWIFGVLQCLSNFAYFVLAQTGKNDSVMVLAINIENFCGGLGTAAFVAFLMSLCNQRFSATQFALLSSLMAVSRDILVAPAGGIAQEIGWTWFFFVTILAALPGLLLLPFFAPWNEEAGK
ncbi:AmpG family muropeptide MFS transporter [Pannus brasiliensis CCIBt3594]|uniref:AmpG family muropeptide MFS transporter n=1 Tax=Pannus brasiliensis CCIBt3594 TaxID=1427578 RepID=A0AAW9QZ33_9CHRO